MIANNERIESNFMQRHEAWLRGEPMPYKEWRDHQRYRTNQLIQTSDRRISWVDYVEEIPHEINSEVYRFKLHGKEYAIDTFVYNEERMYNNLVFISGTSENYRLIFDSYAMNLQDLVLQTINDCIKDGKIYYDSGLFGVIYYDSGLFGDPDIETGWKERPAIETGWRYKTEPKKIMSKPKQELERRKEPPIQYWTPTEDELAQMRIDSAKEKNLPWSKWTKAEIMETCTEAGVSENILKALSKIKLSDLRAMFLIYDDTRMTGNDYNWEQQRNTRFYRLDIDAIMKNNPGLDGFRQTCPQSFSNSLICVQNLEEEMV